MSVTREEFKKLKTGDKLLMRCVVTGTCSENTIYVTPDGHEGALKPLLCVEHSVVERIMPRMPRVGDTVQYASSKATTYKVMGVDEGQAWLKSTGPSHFYFSTKLEHLQVINE